MVRSRYLSKSVRFLRAAAFAILVPHELAAHLPSTSAALSAAARVSLDGDFSSAKSTTSEVTARRRRLITHRWIDGESTSTCVGTPGGEGEVRKQAED